MFLLQKQIYPGVILLFNMTDDYKYCWFLKPHESQLCGPGKMQEVQPQLTGLERQHTRNNKLFSVIRHRKKIPLPTPSCCLWMGDDRVSLWDVAFSSSWQHWVFQPPLMLLLWYNLIHKGNNEMVAQVTISVQDEDADDFAKHVLGSRMWAWIVTSGSDVHALGWSYQEAFN